jgi:hypothetical protein
VLPEFHDVRCSRGADADTDRAKPDAARLRLTIKDTQSQSNPGGEPGLFDWFKSAWQREDYI